MTMPGPVPAVPSAPDREAECALADYLEGCDNPHDRMVAELRQMHDWIDGKRSWTNLGPHEPYTPDVIAVMDAQEVVKHAAAAQAYASMIGIGLTFGASS